jgi:hypothetical protein
VDPTTNLVKQIALAKSLIGRHDVNQEPIDIEAIGLCELVLALDQWLRRGGFLPAPWSQQEILNLSTPGIHAPASDGLSREPLRALCGSDGAYGSPELVTCPKCREKLIDGRIERLSAVVAELLAETTRLGELVDQPDWRERR